jgi:peptide/nickel transport system substrate-binding protein
VTGVTCPVAFIRERTTLGGDHVADSNRHATHRRWTRLGAVAVAIGIVTVAFTGLGGASVRARSHQAASGGDISFGLEAENTNYCLSKSQMAISGIQVVAAVYDTLTVPNSKGQAVPYLAKSVTPNADNTVWTIKLRDGVKFQDGTPVDAAAVKLNMDAWRGAPGAPNSGSLFPIVLSFVQDVAAPDPSPVSDLGHYLYADGRFGIMAPAQINAGDACATKMIGSGPFKLQSYAQNEKTVVVKNPDYWQKGYPKANSITFVPVPDASVRGTQLQGGQLDMMHTTSVEQTDAIKSNSQLKALLQQPGYRELRYYIMLTNNAPFDNPTAREAFTTAIDRKKVNDIRNKGEYDLANSLLKDAGYPKFNEKKAKSLVDQVKSANGGTFDVVLGTTTDPENSAEAQLVKDMLDKAGINSTIAQFDQATLINKALAGDIDVLIWRNLHGGYSDSPDYNNYPWWSNYNTASGGKNLINFARFDNPTTQGDLDKGRSQTSAADFKTTYTDFNKAFAAGNYITPMWWDAWTIGYQPSVKLNLPALPDGGGKPLFVYGRIPVLGLSKSG